MKISFGLVYILKIHYPPDRLLIEDEPTMISHSKEKKQDLFASVGRKTVKAVEVGWTSVGGYAKGKNVMRKK